MTRCDQCDSATINGVFCHEFGCPNRAQEIREENLTNDRYYED